MTSGPSHDSDNRLLPLTVVLTVAIGLVAALGVAVWRSNITEHTAFRTSTGGNAIAVPQDTARRPGP